MTDSPILLARDVRFNPLPPFFFLTALLEMTTFFVKSLNGSPPPLAKFLIAFSCSSFPRLTALKEIINTSVKKVTFALTTTPTKPTTTTKNLLFFPFQTVSCSPVLHKVSEEDGVHSAGTQSVPEDIGFEVAEVLAVIVRLEVSKDGERAIIAPESLAVRERKIKRFIESRQ